MSEAMKSLIYAASEGPLSRAQAEHAFGLLFEGDATDAQMGGLLMAMRARGESVAEYAAAAAVMRAKCNAVSAPPIWAMVAVPSKKYSNASRAWACESGPSDAAKISGFIASLMRAPSSC